MAAAIPTTATTLEGQMWEVANRIQNAELALPEAERPNAVTIGIDREANTITVTATFDATTTVNASGQLVIEPVAYLT